MRRLHLLRHAKSSWDDPALADRDRPLAPRGRKAAKRLAAWVEENGVRAELAICSPAVRTTQTLDRVLAAFGAPEVSVEEDLYHAWADALVERVRQVPESLCDVVLVGHNPGLTDLCLLLSRPGGERERVAGNLPTGALATLELDTGSWREAEPGCAELVRLVLPRELQG